ncbi:MAG: hypothetical protein LW854_09015 [Rubrivivax sp.]|jgi:hypothetical protein|nr:hypothetical protein [Rubrivivax sp.]
MTITAYRALTITRLARRPTLAAAALCLATAASAQMPGPAVPGLTRAAVLADLRSSQARDRWDDATDRWIPRHAGPVADSGLTRDAVLAELAATQLSSHWDAQEGAWLLWVPVARAADAPSRADVTASTQRFLRTHECDAASQAWSEHR